jgi:drug/metabolite transporter (DMT)-like permease
MFGVFCSSTAALMIKASHLHPAVLASYRLLFATVLLSPLYFSLLHKHRASFSIRDLRLVLLPGVTLALHIITWAQGAKLADSASASLIVNMVPIVMPFLLFFMDGEVITGKEVIGTLVSLSGMVLLAAANFGVDRQNFLGNIICFGSMFFLSFYLAQGRVSRHFPSIWLYLVPLYAIAGMICLVVAAFVANPFEVQPTREYILVLGIALVPTMLGHSIMNYSMKHLRGQVVSVLNLGQFVFAGILAYILFHEAPRPVFYGACALVVGGAIIVIRAMASVSESKAHELQEAQELQEAASAS